MLHTKDPDEYLLHPSPPPPHAFHLEGFDHQSNSISSSPPPPPAFNPEYRQDSSYRSVTSAPSRMMMVNDDINNPPIALAIPIPTENHRQVDDDPATIPTTIVQEVIVDESTRTIRIETATNNDGPNENDGERADSQGSSSSPEVGRVTRARYKCWLIPHVKKWFWHTKRLAKATVSRAMQVPKHPQVRRIASRSRTALKEGSIKSAKLAKTASQKTAVFVKEKSIQAKNSALEFNEKHQVVPKVKSSGRLLGRKVKDASVSTWKGVREWETKNEIRAKSKKEFQRGVHSVRQIWKGKQS